MGRIFKINEKYSIVCVSEGTRYGFRHLASLYINGSEGWLKHKICYYNRTWESFEFESVVNGLLDKALKEKILTQEEIETFKSSEAFKYTW